MKHKRDRFYDLLKDYFEVYLPVAKGLSAATIISYKTAFRLLMEYLYEVRKISADKITFSVLTTECIEGFLDWLETERKCSVSTRNQRLSAIAAFSLYAQSRDFPLNSNIPVCSTFHFLDSPSKGLQAIYKL